MPDRASPAPPGTTPWRAILARAVLALVLGVVITLSPEHGATFGLVALGAFALPSGALGLVAALRDSESGLPRVLAVAHGALTLLAGVAALLAWVAALAVVGTGVRSFIALVVVWALATGAVETALGAVRRDGLSRDRVIVGAVTLLLGLAVLLVPADFEQAVVGENGAAGVLTASVVVTGALGAWAVVVGVVLAIAAVTARAPREVAP